MLEPERTEGGTRRYSADDLERLRRIGDLLAGRAAGDVRRARASGTWVEEPRRASTAAGGADIANPST